MLDDPNKRENQHSAEDETSHPEVPVLPRRISDSADKKETEDKTYRTANYIEPALHRLRAIYGWLKRKTVNIYGWIRGCFVSASFWTAAATVAIAVSTFAYTYYARQQWKSMDRQLKDNEAIQSAYLAIEDLKVEAVTSPYLNVRVAYTIRNVGNTIANEINDTSSGSGCIDPAMKAFPFSRETKTNGPSLAPGKTRTVEMWYGVGQVDTDSIHSGKTSSCIYFAVTYRDIFGNAHITSDCRQYNGIAHTFGLCEAIPWHQ